jgi:hypothetical protein
MREMTSIPLTGGASNRLSAFVQEAAPLLAARFGIEFNSDEWQLPAKRYAGERAKRLDFHGVPEPQKSFFKAIAAHEACQKNATGQMTSRNFCTFFNHLIEPFSTVEDLSEISSDHFYRATANFRKSDQSDETKYRFGNTLGSLAKIMNRHRLTRARIEYQNPIPRPGTLYHTDEKTQKKAREKMVPIGALKAFGEIYMEVMAGTGNDSNKLLVCTCAILLCTGYRINELLSMPMDCWHERQAKDPEGRIIHGAFLGYAPEKNGLTENTMPRWIPGSLMPVVKQSLEEIRRITDPYRKNALALAQGRVDVPGLVEGKIYSGNEASALLGVFQQDLNTFMRASGQFQMVKGNSRSGRVYRLTAEDIRKIVRMKSLTEKVVSDPWPQELHESLFVIGDNFFNPHGSTTGTAVPLSYWQVYTFLARSDQRGGTSCFKRFGKINPETGAPWQIPTHNPRHMLNTWMMQGGFSEEEIAQYFGRSNVKDNANYDHMKNWQRIEIVRAALEKGNFMGPWAEIQARIKDPIKREEIKNVMLANVSMSQLGICAHQEGSKPPSIPEACARCPGLIVVKGNPGHIARTREQLGRAEQRVTELRRELERGTFGMGPWVQAEIERRDGLLKVMEVHLNPGIEDGTLVQIPRGKFDEKGC